MEVGVIDDQIYLLGVSNPNSYYTLQGDCNVATKANSFWVYDLDSRTFDSVLDGVTVRFAPGTEGCMCSDSDITCVVGACWVEAGAVPTMQRKRKGLSCVVEDYDSNTVETIDTPGILERWPCLSDSPSWAAVQCSAWRYFGLVLGGRDKKTGHVVCAGHPSGQGVAGADTTAAGGCL